MVKLVEFIGFFPLRKILSLLLFLVRWAHDTVQIECMRQMVVFRYYV